MDCGRPAATHQVDSRASPRPSPAAITIRLMVTGPVVPPARTQRSRRGLAISPGTAVRQYLRMVVGASTDETATTAEELRDAFMAVVADWCATSGVDRHTLVRLGVDPRALDEAGVRQPTARELLRRWWPTAPFTARQLAERSGWSEPTVRDALAGDEADGTLRRVPDGRASLWERTG